MCRETVEMPFTKCFKNYFTNQWYLKTFGAARNLFTSIQKTIGNETKNGSLVTTTVDYRFRFSGLGRRQQTAVKTTFGFRRQQTATLVVCNSSCWRRALLKVSSDYGLLPHRKHCSQTSWNETSAISVINCHWSLVQSRALEISRTTETIK